MTVCVVVPTHNEEKTIGWLVAKIKHLFGYEILVIDDGSVDDTARVARDNGAVVIQNPVNLGKGASLIKGFNYAFSQGFDAVITMDGDGQHLPEEIPLFIKRAGETQAHVYIGNRMSRTKNMPVIRVLTNKAMSLLISLVTKQMIPDSQCGFRLIKKEALGKISLSTCRYETESEFLVKAARQGFLIESVAVSTVYENEASHISPFVDTLRFLKFIFNCVWTTRL